MKATLHSIGAGPVWRRRASIMPQRDPSLGLAEVARSCSHDDSLCNAGFHHWRLGSTTRNGSDDATRERAMRQEASDSPTSARRLTWSLGLAVILCAACGSQPVAPQTSSDRMNKIIEQFERDEPALAGEHWRIVSLEHNPFLVDDLEAFLQELEAEGASRPRLTPVVRIAHEADQDIHHAVKEFLDAGAFGIVLPQVRTAEQVARFVRAMRYPPQRGAQYPEPRGRRGWAPGGALRLWGLASDDYARKADVWPLNPEGELLAIIMVETQESVENIDEIFQVPGLGGALVGRADLSLSLGIGTPAANGTAPEVEAAIVTVGEACVRHNIICGIYAQEDVEERVEQGFRLFPVAP